MYTKRGDYTTMVRSATQAHATAYFKQSICTPFDACAKPPFLFWLRRPVAEGIWPREFSRLERVRRRRRRGDSEIPRWCGGGGVRGQHRRRVKFPGRQDVARRRRGLLLLGPEAEPSSNSSSSTTSSAAAAAGAGGGSLAPTTGCWGVWPRDPLAGGGSHAGVSVWWVSPPLLLLPSGFCGSVLCGFYPDFFFVANTRGFSAISAHAAFGRSQSPRSTSVLPLHRCSD